MLENNGNWIKKKELKSRHLHDYHTFKLQILYYWTPKMLEKEKIAFIDWGYNVRWTHIKIC